MHVKPSQNHTSYSCNFPSPSLSLRPASATPPSSPIFFITFLISYPPASVTVIQIPIVIYVDINGDPSVSSRLSRPTPKGRLTLPSRYYALLNQSCHCYCCLRAPPHRRLSPAAPRLRSFHGCQTNPGVQGVKSVRRRWISMNFINKTTSARNGPTKRGVTARSRSYSVRGGRAWKIRTPATKGSIVFRFSKAGRAEGIPCYLSPWRVERGFVSRLQECIVDAPRIRSVDSSLVARGQTETARTRRPDVSAIVRSLPVKGNIVFR